MNLDGISRHFADMRTRLVEARGELAQASFDGTSDDKRITVTVDAAGQLTGLVIDPRALRKSDSQGLAGAILRAYMRASEEARQRSNELWRSVLHADISLEELDEPSSSKVIKAAGRNLTTGHSEEPDEQE